jgi:RNA polymerase sigma-70 factor (ECF subfamily)
MQHAEGIGSELPSMGAKDAAGVRAPVEIDDDSDRELLRRIGGADQKAFQRLYVRYHQRLTRFVTRLTSRGWDAEDVVNDALLVIWQHAHDFRGASRVSTWIYGITYRCALKSLRRRRVQARADALEIRGGIEITPDAGQETEDQQMLNLGLEQLPKDQRLVLVLAYCLDCSCEEIAAIAGCPVNTVKSRMFHARRKLRTFMAEAG